MKNVLTTLLLFTLMAGTEIISNTANAQLIEGDITIGAGIVYGSGVFDSPGSDDINNDFGIQLNTYYSVTSEIRIGGDITYYLPSEFTISGQDWILSEETTVFELNLNGHYIFVNKAAFIAYGLAGLNFTRVKLEVEDRDDQFGDEFYTETHRETGLNVGAGLEYNMRFAHFYAEAKFGSLGGDADQFVLGSGIRFRF